MQFSAMGAAAKILELASLLAFVCFHMSSICNGQIHPYGTRPPEPGISVLRERVSARRIFQLNSYRDGQLFHFEVPIDTRVAIWRFHTNYTQGCRPGTVSVYLQSGSYPVVSPKNGRFPENMKPLGRFHNLTFNPENGEHSLLVTGPLPGHWFMLAHSTDRKDLGFAQESLSPRCSIWLRTEVEYHVDKNIIQLFPEKHNHEKLLLYHNIGRPQTYRFYTGDSVWSASVTLTKCRVKPDPLSPRSSRVGSSSSDACPIRISVAPRRPPDTLDPKTRKRDCLKDSVGSGCDLKLFPEENSWHYITITPTRTDRRIEFAINVKITDCPHPTNKINYLLVNKINPHEVCSDVTKNTGSAIQLLFPPYQAKLDESNLYRKCGQRIRLVRYTLPGVFMFEYQLPSPSGLPFFNSSSTSPSSLMALELENDVPSVLQFPVGVNDIGGSLVVELGINNGRLSGIPSETFQLKACLSHGKRLIPIVSAHMDPYQGSNLTPLYPSDLLPFNNLDERSKEEEALCPGGRLLALNVSAAERIPRFQRVLVPYPAEGEWFLTLLPSCSNVNVRRGNKETTYDSGLCSRNSTPVVFSIYSDMCVMGGCGGYGRCYQFFSGGNMFSTCSCFAGYKGFGCTDASKATSEIDLLAATLLLCLSNLLFLPAVGLAIYRGFYTESFIYFANMVFSTLFHACDQDVFSFCLMKYTVLQFCDSYTATMAYWVTVLAMGGLPDQAKSLLHMVGAVGVALGIEYDRTGIFTFLVPGAVGIFILFASWISHCSSDRDCYPGFKYTCCFFFPGVVVLCGGLFCFMYLEAESNYQFVHSAWQVSMAVAILFLLPQSPVEQNDKYTILDGRLSAAPPPPSFAAESSFKHYTDENGDVINVTSSSSLLPPPDTVIEVSRAPSLATLNGGGGGGTLPRSTLASRSHHGTLKKEPG